MPDEVDYKRTEAQQKIYPRMMELQKTWKEAQKRLEEAKQEVELARINLAAATGAVQEASTLYAMFAQADNDNRQDFLPPPTPENTPDAS